MVVTENDVKIQDVRIRNGLIERIGENLSDDAVLDASGKYVLPGGIDVHTHMNLDVGIAVAQDDFYTGTVAAACGGTTTIVDHPGFGPKSCGLEHQINYYHTLARNKAVIDYSFHGVVQHVDADVLTKMETLAGEGITSFKIYMTYDYKLADGDIYITAETREGAWRDGGGAPGKRRGSNAAPQRTPRHGAYGAYLARVQPPGGM